MLGIERGDAGESWAGGDICFFGGVVPCEYTHEMLIVLFVTFRASCFLFRVLIVLLLRYEQRAFCYVPSFDRAFVTSNVPFVTRVSRSNSKRRPLICFALLVYLVIPFFLQCNLGFPRTGRSTVCGGLVFPLAR